jgi:hypothetical protein
MITKREELVEILRPHSAREIAEIISDIRMGREVMECLAISHGLRLVDSTQKENKGRVFTGQTFRHCDPSTGWHMPEDIIGLIAMDRMGMEHLRKCIGLDRLQASRMAMEIRETETRLASLKEKYAEACEGGQ